MDIIDMSCFLQINQKISNNDLNITKKCKL